MLKDYCVVLMGDNDNYLPEIQKISEGNPNILDAKGVVIITFVSAMKIPELTDYFKSNNRNFMIFNLNKKCSGVHITKNDIHEVLFGHLTENRQEDLDNLEKPIMDEIVTVMNENNKIVDLKLPTDDIEELSTKELEKLMDTLIDKGATKLSPFDKNLLSKISNKLMDRK